MKTKLDLHLSAHTFAQSLIDADEHTTDGALITQSTAEGIAKEDYPEWKQNVLQNVRTFQQLRQQATVSERTRQQVAKAQAK